MIYLYLLSRLLWPIAIAAKQEYLNDYKWATVWVKVVGQGRKLKIYSLFFLCSLGKIIGNSPWITILISVIIAGLCGIGMSKFTQENRGEKLWNPQDSIALANKVIVDKRYPVASRVNVALFESGNVLTSAAIQSVR